VVDATEIRTGPKQSDIKAPATLEGYDAANPPPAGFNGSVALVVPIADATLTVTVEPAGLVMTFPETSQSPAVSEIDVMFAVTVVVSATAEPAATVEEMYSPTLPACALSFVVVPTIPETEFGVNIPDDDSVVNAPAAGAVPPIAGGDAAHAVNPAPLTVDVADRVVKCPAAGVVPPITIPSAVPPVNPTLEPESRFTPSATGPVNVPPVNGMYADMEIHVANCVTVAWRVVDDPGTPVNP
jgi:hypothetical protein